MKVKLYPDGLAVSKIIAGVWKWGRWGANLSIDAEAKLIKSCVEAGITSFDHADIYGDYEEEARFGTAFKALDIPREKIELITKCGIKLCGPNRPNHSVKCYDTTNSHIIQSVENSLQALQTDYIDLVLIHRPSPLMDFRIIAESFETLKQQGKVLHFGVSNFNCGQFEALNKFTPLATNQVEASLLHLEPFLDGCFDQLQTLDVKPMIWSPLGSGKLFGASDDNQVNRIKQTAIKLCEKYECTDSQIYLAFLLKHPANLIPVLGTSKTHRIQEAIKALDIQLTNDEWFELWIAAMGSDVP